MLRTTARQMAALLLLLQLPAALGQAQCPAGMEVLDCRRSTDP